MFSTKDTTNQPQNRLSQFEIACKEVLTFLRGKFGFQLWMVTRTQGDAWIVLQSIDQGYNVAQGSVFRWTDSFCSRMVRGLGPTIAPSSAEIASYAEAPIGQQVPIKAYIGVPLTNPDGSLFGTLCAIDPHEQPREIENEEPLILMLANLLSTILKQELELENAHRAVEHFKNESTLDPLTNVFNRRGWDQLLNIEESRCKRYGHAAAVIAVDLDQLKSVNDTYGHSKGDELIKTAASALVSCARDKDVVARLGGDEFCVLVTECDSEGAKKLLTRARTEFEKIEINASFGMAVRTPTSTIVVCWESADANMYEEKRSKRLAKPTVD